PEGAAGPTRSRNPVRRPEPHEREPADGADAHKQDRRLRRRTGARGSALRHPRRGGDWIQLVWDAGHATVLSGFRMIYHLSLQAAGYIAGIFLSLFGLWGLIRPDASQAAARTLPRSRVAGFVLLTLALFWTVWLL